MRTKKAPFRLGVSFRAEEGFLKNAHCRERERDGRKILKADELGYIYTKGRKGRR